MNKKILIIEDEPTLQKVMTKMLQDEGFEIKNALDGETGLLVASEFNPDLILLDLILPRKNGFEVLDQLKQNEETKAIPVLVLSNLENSQDIQRAVSLGAIGYLVKSNYDIENIIKKIKEVIN